MIKRLLVNYVLIILMGKFIKGLEMTGSGELEQHKLYAIEV